MTTSDERYWIGFDLGGTKMLATVFDKDFERCGKERKKTRGHEGVEAGVARMVKAIEDALLDAEVPVDQVAGIGVGVPGPVDMLRGFVHETANLGWKDVPLQRLLSRHFDCPIVILNDVDAGVYGENCFGAAKSARCVVGVFPGTGIGGGCVYQGEILVGSASSCMEIGHIPMVPDGPLSGFRQEGTLETVGSRLAIAAQAAQAAYRGQAPNLLAAAGTDIQEIRSGQLAAAIEAGDTIIEAIVRNAAAHVGRAVAGVMNLLCPDVVIAGGGLVEAMPKLMVQAIEEAASEFILPSFRPTFRIAAAELGDYATVMGAAAWARKTTEEKTSADAVVTASSD